MIDLSTVDLQFQSWLVPISLRQFLGIVAAYIRAPVWSSRSRRHLAKVSARMWLRILPVTLQEEPEAPDSASCLTCCLLSLDCLPLFLRPLASLIQTYPLAKVFPQRQVAEPEKGPQGPAPLR